MNGHTRTDSANRRAELESLPKPHAASAVNIALPLFFALAVLFVMAYAGWKWYQVRQFQLASQQAIPDDYIGPALTEFELTERSGEPFRSADMRGRVWVATYFFTTCPGSCTRLNQSIKLLHDMPELEDVTWVSVTCDPDTDTVDVLGEYADRFQADPERWLFCRANMEYTQRVARGMNLALFRKGHTDHAIVIDKEGKIRGVYDATSRTESQRLRTKLLECLAEDPPPNVATPSVATETS